jgi:hypothetical protein
VAEWCGVKYRIVELDGWCKIQAKRWWLPFWIDSVDEYDTAYHYSSVHEAQAAIKRFRRPPPSPVVVWTEGECD